MNFKKNALSVLTAAALAGTVGTAQAFWQDGEADDNVGNGEFLLVAYDDVAKVSVIQDLGGSYVDFFSNEFTTPTNTFSVALDPLFDTTFTNPNDVVFSVLAVNNGNPFLNPNAGTSGLMVTSGVANPTMTTIEYNGFNSWINAILSPNINGADDPADQGLNLAYFGDSNNGAYAGTNHYYGANAGQMVSFNVVGSATDSLMMYNFATSDEGQSPVAAGGLWSLDLTGGSISYAALAPVPLPAAVWLFLSGLLGFGAVARRGKNA